MKNKVKNMFLFIYKYIRYASLECIIFNSTLRSIMNLPWKRKQDNYSFVVTFDHFQSEFVFVILSDRFFN